MFHPANYAIAFLGFLFRFDIVTAMYARLSTRVLLVTINNPARNILVGLFPDEFRAMLRPFLRGTVVRVGILIGSGIIFLSEHLVHPRWLSIVGLIVALSWVATSIWLKRSYSDILLGLIGRNVIDLRSLQDQDVGVIFKDKRAQDQLVDACRNSHGKACLWYAEMMKAQQVPDMEQHLLELISTKDEKTAISLLPLVPKDAGERALLAFEALADPAKPQLTAALAEAAGRLPMEESATFLRKLLDQDRDLRVRAQAVIGLYQLEPAKYHPIIEHWLQSEDHDQLRAGIIAAGGSGNKEFRPGLRRMLAAGPKSDLVPDILAALGRLEDPRINELVLERLHQDISQVPLEVLRHFDLGGETELKAFIHLLGSEDKAVRDLALERLSDAENLDSAVLIEALSLPNRRLRSGLYELMGQLKIGDREIIAFAKSSLEMAYSNIAEAEALKKLPETQERDLLIQHLMEHKKYRVETILRVLATQEESDQMRLVIRGLSSADGKLRSNAVEALESMVGSELSQAMLPLVEDGQVSESLTAGRKLFKLPTGYDGVQGLMAHLLAKKNWVTLYLTLVVLGQQEEGLGPYLEDLKRLAKNRNLYVSSEAAGLAAKA
ncbi:MAG: hypothetical protein KQI62_20685, partial [Deltaproteobacteria bacterium]|nr:hypothetical protein [Deltaproteobacteria bacterium]